MGIYGLKYLGVLRKVYRVLQKCWGCLLAKLLAGLKKEVIDCIKKGIGQGAPGIEPESLYETSYQSTPKGRSLP
jgi:hypothetical protein